MQKVFIDDYVQMEIDRLKKNANDNVVSLQEIKKLYKNNELNYKRNRESTIYIPDKFCVTYSHEEQPGQIICRHMSVSTSIEDKLPKPDSVGIIMTAFGFVNGFDNIALWLEKFGSNYQTAVNLLEPISGNMDEIRKK